MEVLPGGGPSGPLRTVRLLAARAVLVHQVPAGGGSLTPVDQRVVFRGYLLLGRENVTTKLRLWQASLKRFQTFDFSVPA